VTFFVSLTFCFILLICLKLTIILKLVILMKLCSLQGDRHMGLWLMTYWLNFEMKMSRSFQDQGQMILTVPDYQYIMTNADRCILHSWCKRLNHWISCHVQRHQGNFEVKGSRERVVELWMVLLCALSACNECMQVVCRQCSAILQQLNT